MLYYIKKTWKNSFLTILCQVISYSIEVFAALASMKMLDGLLAQDTQLFLFGLVAHLGVWAISFLASHMETVFHYRAQRQINELERKDMVEMLLKKSYSEYYAEESGSYLSGFTNDIAQMEQLGWEPLFGMFGVLAQIVSSLIALFYLHWSLLAVSIIFGILMVLLPRIFNQKLENAGNICSRLQAEAVSQFKELLAGYDVLRSFGKKDRMVCGTETANEQMETPRYHLKVLKSAIGNGMGFLSVVFQVSVRLLAGILILMGILNLSVMVSVSTICSNVYNGLKQLVNLQLSLTSGKPYFEKLSNHRDTVSHDNKKSLPVFSRSISVENLSFNYGKKTVLNHASFSFEKGKKYALTGPSGCGKSTLLKILLGWLPDYTGCVCFDDIDIHTVATEQLQQQMSYIEQNVFLFNASIRENILLGEDFTEEQLRNAIHDSALENDLMSMPNGLDTLVGEGGCNISGGQKQRVAIARALIHNRSILLVDEGTSALDAQNADRVEKSLLANPNLTLILISHHLTPERKKQFDKVYELSTALNA